MRNWKLLAAAVIITSPIAANAQDAGVYISAGVGASGLQDQAVSFGGVNSKVRESLGGLGSVSVGYNYGNGVRAEVQADYRSNEIDRIGGAVSRGQRHQYGAFLNGFYDFKLDGDFKSITPYVGLGVGYERVELQNVSSGPVTAYGHDGNFAMQAMVGAAYQIPGVDGLQATLEYRATDIPGNVNMHAAAAGFSTRGRSEGGLSQAGVLGLRYTFGAAQVTPVAYAPPTPQAVTAPIPAPARTYLVFFDWDKADLGERARAIIAQAANAAQRTSGVTRIDVSGHADKTGTASYNQTLSLKRANTVAAELVRLGVPKQEIAISAFGDTKPLVPTAPGVREPQNRRVEIVLK